MPDTSSRASEGATRERRRILVRGTVQGVGFRPFVYHLATAFGLAGFVTNTTEGVVVEAEGDAGHLAQFIAAIGTSPPVNATVTAIEHAPCPVQDATAFAIIESLVDGARTTNVPADLATCEACLRELFDPKDRRYRYPFTNCTDCGPRYSIIEDLPYDRASTSMRRFAMCPRCRAEYADPTNRRFHAEPNACPDCGPQIALWDKDGCALATGEAALAKALRALREGAILAVKGLGGFHLMANARNSESIGLLRKRKHREEKPFAVMFPSLDAIAACCRVSPDEAALLTAPARPIVLVKRKTDDLAPSVAPNNPYLGVFLPYTPLHHLILQDFAGPLVATSGNLADEPIVTDETAALARLSAIADLFLIHDRVIVRPLDDSILRLVAGRELVLRRARGLTPAPIPVDGGAQGIIALGGHLKASIAVGRGGEAILGQHIGDLETFEARKAFEHAVADVPRLYDVTPTLAACDLHPDYVSSHIAASLGMPLCKVQHHHAHVLSCMTEHGLAPPVLGVAFDGAGLGTDGTIWGGEFLRVSEDGFQRVAHLRPFRLPGGESAMREPRRSAFGLLYGAFGKAALAMTDLAPIAAFSAEEGRILGAALEHGVNAPLTSSMGRLFDAVAALLDLRQKVSYEGQGACELEWAACDVASAKCYPFDLATSSVDGVTLVLDWRPALTALLDDWRSAEHPGVISAAFHNGVAAAVIAVARRIGEPRVALSGGCFQNKRLTETIIARLRAAGFAPYWHQRVPPNDGGLALGQLAAARRANL